MNRIQLIIITLLCSLAAFLFLHTVTSAANAQEPDRFVLSTHGDIETILVLDPTTRDSCGILIHEPGTAKTNDGNKLAITGVFGVFDQAPMFSVSMIATGPKPNLGPLDAEVNFIDEGNNITQPWVFHANVYTVPNGVIIHTETNYEELDAFITDMMENPFVTLGQGSNLYYRWSTDHIEEAVDSFVTCMDTIQPLGDSVQPTKGEDL